MFESSGFRGGIVDALDIAAHEYRLKGYDDAIPDILQFLAMSNEDFLTQLEQKRSPLERRGMLDALSSAKTLSMTAGREASERMARQIEIKDMARSYAFHFCGVWPFCR